MISRRHLSRGGGGGGAQGIPSDRDDLKFSIPVNSRKRVLK